jgi:hypothetical protein
VRQLAEAIVIDDVLVGDIRASSRSPIRTRLTKEVLV